MISLLHSSSPADRVWYLFWCLLSFDVTAVFSPLLQRVRDLSESLDIFRMLIWLLPSPLLQRVRDLIWRLQNVDLTAGFFPLLQNVCDVLWCLQNVDLTAEFSLYLQGVRDLFWCLQNVDLTAGFSPSCRAYVIFFNAWKMWIWLLHCPPLLQIVRDVFWYLRNVDLIAVLSSLQIVREVVCCLQNVDLTTVFLPSCRPYVTTL